MDQVGAADRGKAVKRQVTPNGPTTVSFTGRLLWEDELRTAAKALDRFFTLHAEHGSDESHAEMISALIAALHACAIALEGAEDDDCTLLLGSKRDLRRRKSNIDRPEAAPEARR